MFTIAHGILYLHGVWKWVMPVRLNTKIYKQSCCVICGQFIMTLSSISVVLQGDSHDSIIKRVQFCLYFRHHATNYMYRPACNDTRGVVNYM